jgi:hypothetical protein
MESTDDIVYQPVNVSSDALPKVMRDKFVFYRL